VLSTGSAGGGGGISAIATVLAVHAEKVILLLQYNIVDYFTVV
jgi:hypothetical protein